MKHLLRMASGLIAGGVIAQRGRRDFGAEGNGLARNYLPDNAARLYGDLKP